MIESKPKIIWNASAIKSFEKIYKFIEKDSLSNAQKVISEIIKLIEALPNQPEKFPPDKFRKNNTGEFRAFEKYSYRIAYKFSKNEIRVLRIRHVKQEPPEH